MDWIQRIRSHENEALADLYKNYRNEAVHWAQKEFSCGREEALDLFQASIVILYDNVVCGKLTHLTSDIKTYIFGIIRNKGKEWSRANQKQLNFLSNSPWLNYVVEESPDEVQEELLKVAGSALEELGPPCNVILQYYYYQDKSMDEITSTMGYKNADTTKNQKYKCLKRLQNIFSSHLQKTTTLEK